jgi:manganese/zinc/iron transport system permease protein
MMPFGGASLVAVITPTYNTLVVAAGVAAVGAAAGVIGSLGVLRRRALVGDAAAHATLVGLAAALALTGRRDLGALLCGGLVAAAVAVGLIVLIRRGTRTRDDAATAIVLSVSFGLGVVLVSGMIARGVPGSGGLERFLLGHSAALTAADAMLLTTVSGLVVLLVVCGLKEATLVTFDPDFAASAGWPVAAIDLVLAVLVAVMVVVGLPAAGAVLVTALVVIPPVAARQWTDRLGWMLTIAAGIGMACGLVGVAVSTTMPRLSTGPLVVLAATLVFGVSFLFAPERGWVWRRWQAGCAVRLWEEGRMLEAALDLEDSADRNQMPGWTWAAIQTPTLKPAGRGQARHRRASWQARRALVRRGLIEPVSGRGDDATWRLSATGRDTARERKRRRLAWQQVLATAPVESRRFLSLELPDPQAVLPASWCRAPCGREMTAIPMSTGGEPPR